MCELFKPKKVIFKGRSGIIFNPNEIESYYIDSEMLNGKYDIVIYKDNIYSLFCNKILSDIDKNKILHMLLKELDDKMLKYEIK